MTSEVDLPVWYQDSLHWVTGLTRRTTCDDVIYAILTSLQDEDAQFTEHYDILEKWRGVERPLSVGV